MSEQTPETQQAQQESQAEATAAPAAESSNGAVREVRWGPDDTSELDEYGISDEFYRNWRLPTLEEAPAYWRKTFCMDAYHSLRMSGINISLKKIKERRYAEWSADPDHPLNPNRQKSDGTTATE